MANEPEVIRHEMKETRTALTEKLEALEQHVLGTVENATCAVNETVTNVKDAVQDTVSSVKELIGDTVDTVRETFNLELQTRRHPWAMVGAAVGAGYLSGMLLHRASPVSGRSLPSPTPQRFGAEAPALKPSLASSAMDSSKSLLSRFEPELEKVKGMALGSLFNVVKGIVQPYVPPNVQPQFNELVDNVTRKFGGQPIAGSILERS